MEYHGLKIFWTMTVIGGIINMSVFRFLALSVCQSTNL
jgi:hypothetical protein